MNCILLFAVSLPSIFTLINGFPQGYSENYIPPPRTEQKQLPTLKPLTFSLFGTPFPDAGRKHAIPEYEDSLLSKIDTSYGRLQELAANVKHPKPIVDNLKEEEKYGNDGEQHRVVGKVIVNGFEGFFNLLNSAFEFPFAKTTKISKSITKELNKLGGKLVGLDYKSK